MRGGKRPGAGRKPGSKSQAIAKRELALAVAGITPKQFMLDGLAWHQGLVAAEKAKGDKADAAKITAAYVAGKEFAKDVAPYCHSRYGTIEGDRANTAPPPVAEDAPRAAPDSNVGEIVTRFRTASVAQPNGNGAVKH